MDNDIIKIIFCLFVIIFGGILTIGINSTRGVQRIREKPKGLIKGPPPPIPPKSAQWLGKGPICSEHPCNRDKHL